MTIKTEGEREITEKIWHTPAICISTTSQGPRSDSRTSPGPVWTAKAAAEVPRECQCDVNSVAAVAAAAGVHLISEDSDCPISASSQSVQHPVHSCIHAGCRPTLDLPCSGPWESPALPTPARIIQYNEKKSTFAFVCLSVFFGHCHCTRFRDSFCLASVFDMTVYLLTYLLTYLLVVDYHEDAMMSRSMPWWTVQSWVGLGNSQQTDRHIAEIWWQTV